MQRELIKQQEIAEKKLEEERTLRAKAEEEKRIQKENFNRINA